jgi:plasmid stability protein
MTITLDISPETKEELARQAAAHGLGVGAYAASLLEEAAHAASDKPLPAAAAKDMVELFAPLRGLNLDFERDRDTGREINL